MKHRHTEKTQLREQLFCLAFLAILLLAGYALAHQSVQSDGSTETVVPENIALPDIDKTTPAMRPKRDKLLAMLKPDDPNTIFAVFDAIEADKSFALTCHDVAHDIGHRAYELYGFPQAMTFSNPEQVNHAKAQEICAGGYTHGILEELFLHQPTMANTPGLMCGDVPDANRASCFHGVGHALMIVAKRDVQASLTACRSLEHSTDTHRCFEGVWMELFWGSTKYAGPDSLGWNLTKPLAPCIATADDAKPACFLYSTFGYMRTHPQDYAGVITLCRESDLRLSDEQFCLKGVGLTLVGHLKAKNLERLEPYANGLTQDEKLGFYEGVIGYARFSGVDEEALISTCNLLQSDTAICLTALKESK